MSGGIVPVVTTVIPIGQSTSKLYTPERFKESIVATLVPLATVLLKMVTKDATVPLELIATDCNRPPEFFNNCSG